MCGGEHLTTRKGQKKSGSCRRNIGKNIRKTRRHTIKINQVYNKIEAECERSGCKVKKCNWQRNLGTKKHRDGVENGKGGGHIGAEGEGAGGRSCLTTMYYYMGWGSKIWTTFDFWKVKAKSEKQSTRKQNGGDYEVEGSLLRCQLLRVLLQYSQQGRNDIRTFPRLINIPEEWSLEVAIFEEDTTTNRYPKSIKIATLLRKLTIQSMQLCTNERPMETWRWVLTV